MSYGQTRALLDSLMGVNRDGDKADEVVSDFRDRRTCKDFLAGLCTHELFSNTKADKGPCPKTHDENLRNSYTSECEASLKERYELDLMDKLQREVIDCDRKLQRGEQRINEDVGQIPELDRNDEARADKILVAIVDIHSKLIEAERLGEAGDVEGSMLIMEQVEDLKQQSDDTGAVLIPTIRLVPGAQGGGVSSQNLRVCETCGAMLSIFDSDRRLEDHFFGKLHMGYQQIRDVHAKLKEKYKGKSNRRESTASSRDTRIGDRGNARDRDRSDRGSGAYHRRDSVTSDRRDSGTSDRRDSRGGGSDRRERYVPRSRRSGSRRSRSRSRDRRR